MLSKSVVNFPTAAAAVCDIMTEHLTAFLLQKIGLQHLSTNSSYLVTPCGKNCEIVLRLLYRLHIRFLHAWII